MHLDAQPRDSQDALDQAIAILHAVVCKATVSEAPPPPFADHAQFAVLYQTLLELRQFTLALAYGDLSGKLHSRGYLAGAMKSLQASLRHLTWQTQQIAAGDFTQQVDFMGEFSRAFNTMVTRLADVRTALEHEIAEREHAEAAEREQRHLAEALQRAGQVLGSSLDLDQVLDRILELARALVAYDAAQLFLEAEGDLTPVRAAGAGMDPAILRRLAASAGPCSLLPGADGRPGTWIGVPILAHEQVIGYLALFNKERGYFHDEHCRRLAAFAGQAALALQNARLFRAVERLATTDSLTGIYNRRHFMALAITEMSRSTRFRHPLSAVMLDIDHFKRVNDTCGHLVGDMALREVAQRCTRQLRPYDIIARYGGEEFVLLLPQTDADGAREVAERLRASIEAAPVTANERRVPLTISLGVSTTPGEMPFDPSRAELVIAALINEADQALYASKQRGRNRVTHWRDSGTVTAVR